MRARHVASLEDPCLEPYKDLKARSTAGDLGDHVIAEGLHLVERLLASRLEVRSVLVSRSRAERLESLAAPSGVEALVLEDELVPRLVGFPFHRGVLACASRPRIPALATLAPDADASVFLLVAHDIADPVNLGGLVRTAAAFGLDGFVVSGAGCDPFSRRALRASMGATLGMRLLRSDDLSADLRHLRDRTGLECAACVLSAGATHLDEVRERPRRLALLVGNEGHGLPASLAATCEHRWTLPMADGTDSLNVGVAAGIFIHQLSRLPTTA